eukprot:13550449-Heterocapsa_arctica.AAC.1
MLTRSAAGAARRRMRGHRLEEPEGSWQDCAHARAGAGARRGCAGRRSLSPFLIASHHAFCSAWRGRTRSYMAG